MRKEEIAFLRLDPNYCLSVSFNYYEILGLEQGAGAADIKAAYRSLAMEYHPDKNPSPDAHKQFVAINAAYNTLSDPFKRKLYDLRSRTNRVLHTNVQRSSVPDNMSPEEMRRSYWNSPAGKRKREELKNQDNNWYKLGNILLFLSIPIVFFIFFLHLVEIFRFEFRDFNLVLKPLNFLIMGLIAGMWYFRKRANWVAILGILTLISTLLLIWKVVVYFQGFGILMILV